MADENLLRALPPVDALLHTSTGVDLRALVGAAKLTQLARAVIEELRADLRGGLCTGDMPSLLTEAERRLAQAGPDPKLGKAIPYGVYDLSANQGWVSVGVDHDTAEFATESVQRWWRMMGQPRYPTAQELLILADGGGSNSSRSRLWKFCLQKLADASGLTLTVCHFPPATSKWNKIEHRMFCHITQNWRGKPLVSHEVVVQLIAATTTEKGLRIQAEIDPTRYPLQKKVSAQELAEVQITRDGFHGEWNYSIRPRPRPS